MESQVPLYFPLQFPRAYSCIYTKSLFVNVVSGVIIGCKNNELIKTLFLFIKSCLNTIKMSSNFDHKRFINLKG